MKLSELRKRLRKPPEKSPEPPEDFGESIIGDPPPEESAETFRALMERFRSEAMEPMTRFAKAIGESTPALVESIARIAPSVEKAIWTSELEEFSKRARLAGFDDAPDAFIRAVDIMKAKRTDEDHKLVTLGVDFAKARDETAFIVVEERECKACGGKGRRRGLRPARYRGTDPCVDCSGTGRVKTVVVDESAKLAVLPKGSGRES